MGTERQTFTQAKAHNESEIFARGEPMWPFHFSSVSVILRFVGRIWFWGSRLKCIVEFSIVIGRIIVLFIFTFLSRLRAFRAIASKYQSVFLFVQAREVIAVHNVI